MVDIFTINQPAGNYSMPIQQEVTLETHMDFSKFTNGNDVPIITPSADSSMDAKQKRKRRERSSNAGVITDTLDGDNTSSRELTMLESNEPYENKYQETTNMLRSAIADIDVCMGEVHDDIQVIRSSKTMKSKYNYLSLMHGAMNGLIGNKITAARELNNTISKCADLELKRYKEVKAVAAASEQDDNKHIQDMYQAFISTPVGNRGSALGPTVAEMSVPSANIVGNMIGSADQQYANYMANLTPAQNMMLLESNPNIKQVVVYNQETGARYFDVIDMSTGESVPNVEKHDSMFLEDVTINLRDRIATNTNLGETYPLVIVGQPILNEY